MYRKLINIFITILVLLSYSFAEAQITPTVSSVQTSGYRGTKIIIRGNNFKANGDTVPRVYFGSGSSWTALDEVWRRFSTGGSRWYWDNNITLIFRIPHYIDTGAQNIKICAGYDRDDPSCGSCCIDTPITIKPDESGESFGPSLRINGYGIEEGHAENVLYSWYRYGMEEAGDTYLSYDGHIFFPVYRHTEKAIAVLIWNGVHWAKYIIAKPVEWATNLSVSLVGTTVRVAYTDRIGARTKDIYTQGSGISVTPTGSSISQYTYILPLGDSITAGAGDTTVPILGYRRNLQALLGLAGNYIYVGSQVEEKDTSYLSYDYHHAGIYGETTLNILDRFLSREVYGIKEDINTINQFLLIHAGTNDFLNCCCNIAGECPSFGSDCDAYQNFSDDSTCSQISDFAINNIRTIATAAYNANNNTKVILSKITPVRPQVALQGSIGVNYHISNPAIVLYNQKLVDLYHELRFAGHNVFLVNSFTGYKAWTLGGHMSDNVHPNSSGYDLIGTKFAAGITNFNTNNEYIDDCDLEEVFCIDNFEQVGSSEGEVEQNGNWSFWGDCTLGCMDASHGIFNWNSATSARIAGTNATTALGDQNVYYKYIFNGLTETTTGTLHIRWGSTGGFGKGYLRVAVDENADGVAEKTWQGATAFNQNTAPHTWVYLPSDAPDGSWDFEPGATVTTTSDRNQGIFTVINMDAVKFDSRSICVLDSDCDDLLYCNGEEYCDLDTSVCMSGINPCPEDDGLFCNGITTGCDEATDACIHSGNPCTPDLCDEETDSCYPSGECTTNDDCDDDLYCNGEEYCSGGDCFSGTPVDCDDSDPCTDDSCNETTDSCDHPITKDTDEDNYIDDQCAGGDDCDDSNFAINPGQFEGPAGDVSCTDTVDNDCDTLIDAADPGCAGVGVATKVIIINTQ